MTRGPSAKTVVVALGGNAITPARRFADAASQLESTRRSLAAVAPLFEGGRRVVVTHGNGPQIGEALLRVEAARRLVPPQPLGVLVAETQGSIGYMIVQALHEVLGATRGEAKVACLLTRVVVDPDDPSFGRPTKFVGPAYSAEEARELAEEHGWSLAEDVGRGFRRVVPSPEPLEVVEAPAVRDLLDAGAVVVCAGGGGVPVSRTADGRLVGLDAVIDKDRASAVLGLAIGAEELVILSAVECVYLHYREPGERPLREMDVPTARRYLAEGHFPAGSMGPKIEAAIRFLEGGGRSVLITSAARFADALRGEAGTRLSA